MDNLSKSLVHEKARRLSSYWYENRSKLSLEERRQISMSYLRHIIGCDDSILEGFEKGDHKALDYVGNRHAGLCKIKLDNDSFWKELNKISPDFFPKKDLEWLIKVSRRNGASFLLSQLDPTEEIADNSDPIRLIHANMLVYK